MGGLDVTIKGIITHVDNGYRRSFYLADYTTGIRVIVIPSSQQLSAPIFTVGSVIQIEKFSHLERVLLI